MPILTRARLQHRRAATAGPRARTASTSRSSATTRRATTGPSPATAASAGSRGSRPTRACSSSRRPAASPHGGGQRLAIGSPEYQTLLAWVRDGAPERAARPHGAVDERPRSSPARRSGSTSPGPQQLRVVARYADGHERDVTRLASFKLNDDSAASVTPAGHGRPCSAAPRPT